MVARKKTSDGRLEFHDDVVEIINVIYIYIYIVNAEGLPGFIFI